MITDEVGAGLGVGVKDVGATVGDAVGVGEGDDIGVGVWIGAIVGTEVSMGPGEVLLVELQPTLLPRAPRAKSTKKP